MEVGLGATGDMSIKKGFLGELAVGAGAVVVRSVWNGFFDGRVEGTGFGFGFG